VDSLSPKGRANQPLRVLAGIPVKPFGVAKRRLGTTLDARQRSKLGRAVAAHTAATARAAGFEVAVVTGDDGVRAWARGLGLETVAEETSHLPGLDGAADALRTAAAQHARRWVVLHADIPLVSANDMAALLEAVHRGDVIAPSYDGGTSALSTTAALTFRYGEGSFHRHLRQIPDATVLVRPGLALDLDTEADLREMLRRRPGGWIVDLVKNPGLRP